MQRIFTSLALMIIVCNSFSQEEDKLLVAETKQSTVITEPATLNRGFFKIGSEFTYAIEDRVLTESGKRDYSTGNGWGRSSSENLHFYYGITNRIELGLIVPYKFRSMHRSYISDTVAADTSILVKWETGGNGIGDMRFIIRYQIIEGSKTKPSLTAALTAFFPTGEKNPTNISGELIYDHPTGSGEILLIPELSFRKVAYPYSYSFWGYFQYGFGCEKKMLPYEDAIHFRSGSRFILGGNFNFLLNDWIAVQNDLTFENKRGDTYTGNTMITSFMPSNDSWALIYAPGISFQFKKIRLAQGVSIPLLGKFWIADPQYRIMLQYIL
jgi:hypothetical protein